MNFKRAIHALSVQPGLGSTFLNSLVFLLSRCNIKKPNEVTENKGVKGFIFDGFPRTLNQAESLDVFVESVNQKINVTIAATKKEESI